MNKGRTTKKNKNERKKHARLEMIKRNTGKMRELWYMAIMIFWREIICNMHRNIACTRLSTGLCRFFACSFVSSKRYVNPSTHTLDKLPNRRTLIFQSNGDGEQTVRETCRKFNLYSKREEKKFSGAHMCTKRGSRTIVVGLNPNEKSTHSAHTNFFNQSTRELNKNNVKNESVQIK